ncbi:Peptidoglycan-N-acetylglucosamine deacetylase [compost metagenome]
MNLDDLGAHPIYRGNPNKPMVAFMINVAWGNEYIVPMLNTLDKNKVKATFFLDGSWLKKNSEMALEIQKRGHQIENHAYSHPNMSQLEATRARLEISKTKDLLKEKLGVQNRWFAPPSGDFNDRTVALAAEQGLKTVLWTLDTVDWMKPSAVSIVSKISKKVEPGSLILMHPTASSRDALQGMIDAIRNKGLVLDTVDETLSSNRVNMPQS